MNTVPDLSSDIKQLSEWSRQLSEAKSDLPYSLLARNRKRPWHQRIYAIWEKELGYDLFPRNWLSILHRSWRDQMNDWHKQAKDIERQRKRRQ